MAEPWLELDAVLRERLREVLQEPPRPLTESELRSLLEEDQACMLILSGELERFERRLAHSTAIRTPPSARSPTRFAV